MKITINADLSLEVFEPNQEETTEKLFFKGDVFEVEVLNVENVAPGESYITVKTESGTVIPGLVYEGNELITFEE